MIYLDTHVIAWLYAGKIDLIPKRIQNIISKEAIFISPMVILELQFLYEIGKVTKKGTDVIHDLENRIDLKICKKPFPLIIQETMKQKWTRDPFDRIIVATASVDSSKLITKDNFIRKNYKYAKWA